MSQDQGVRPLRRCRLDGTPYYRREHVQAELEALLKLSAQDLQERARVWPKGRAGFVSSEALVHLVRVATPRSRHQERLVAALMQRLERRLPKPAAADGETVSRSRTLVRDRVRDDFVDLLIGDRDAYDDRLDYYEISFDNAVARDRVDAKRQVNIEENRSQELGSDEDDSGISLEVEEALGPNNPFDPDRLDEKAYRQRLEAAIDALPPLQQEIVHMWTQDIPIWSGDPDVLTISKALGKAEKTIRTHRDKAFAFLRTRLTRLEP